MADGEPGPGNSLPRTPSTATNDLPPSSPEYPRVSYCLSPETGLAEIIEEPCGDSSETTHPTTPVYSDEAIHFATPTKPAWDTSMQEAPKLEPALPVTPSPRIRMSLEDDDRWPLTHEGDDTSSATQEEDKADCVFEHIRGPVGEVAAHLRLTTEKWHAQNPRAHPEWASRLSIPYLRGWGTFKVFSRDGDENDLSVHKVGVMSPGQSRAFHYPVMILHSEGCIDQFVAISACRPSMGKGNARLDPVHGQYLIAWDGAKGEWEDEVAAVRIATARGSDSEASKLVFWPSLFDKAYGKIQPCRWVKNHKNGGKDSDKGGPNRPVKKRRIIVDENGSPGPSLTSKGVARRLLYHSEVRIKFSSADNVRQFPLEECDVAMLFQKARQFYGTMKMPPGTNSGLSCKMDGLAEARFIGEGCEDEWDIFCRDIRDLTLKEDGPHLLEVQPAEV